MELDKNFMNAELKCIAMKDNIPDGWRNLELFEAKEMKSRVHNVCKYAGDWYIVGISQGKIDGTGYGNKIHDTRGKECGVKIIIKKVDDFRILLGFKFMF